MRPLTLLAATLVATLTTSAQGSDSGCTDVTAFNYNTNALTDDGSCFHLSITGTSEICSGETTELTAQLQGSVITTSSWPYANVVETPSMLTVPGEYGTIAAALSASSDGDTILVAPGSYIGTYDLPSSHGVHLISESGPDVTTLDGNQAESVLAVAGSGFEYTIQGFTITGGYAYQYTTVCNGKMGGGIEICGGAVVTVQDNIVINNLGRHRGGGIRLASDNCIIRRNVIAFNTTPQGWASFDGGAGLCIQASDFIVENNTICYNNESGNYNHGAGVLISTNGGTFRNNIVYHNTGGDQIYFQMPVVHAIDTQPKFNGEVFGDVEGGGAISGRCKGASRILRCIGEVQCSVGA
ncbi:right-handed parallel beta-helix repeat-containing protein [Flavobacteriales bacterium]|nr:right-handed parallel beta-helix repeat-containing protein [Flavobacteriales bacterium]